MSLLLSNLKINEVFAYVLVTIILQVKWTEAESNVERNICRKVKNLLIKLLMVL